MIRIRSKKPGFRRCGIAHPAVWTEYPEDRFSDIDLERLLSEPMLQVEVTAQETEMPVPTTGAPDIETEVPDPRVEPEDSKPKSRRKGLGLRP